MRIAPGSNVIKEKLEACLRTFKSWLRIAVTQEKLNHFILKPVHKNETNVLDLTELPNQFGLQKRYVW